MGRVPEFIAPKSSKKAGTCRFPAAARRYEIVFCKGWSHVTLFVFSVVQRSCFCEKVPLEKSIHQSWACCGGAKCFPRRLGLGWLISLASLIWLIYESALFLNHPAKFFQRLPGSWRGWWQIIIGVVMVKAVGSQVTQILNKANQPDTCLLFLNSVVVLGVNFHQ